MQIRLTELEAERLLAPNEGLAADNASMGDLEDGIVVVAAAHLEAAVTDIATLRAELFGPQQG